jgi:predicted membrane protein
MDIITEKTEVKRTHRGVHRTGIIFGILLILLGGLLISANSDLLPNNMDRVIISWQMLLIVIGILSMFKRHVFGGLFFILIGGFFIVPRLAEVFPLALYWVNAQFISDYWSGLLVGAGILIVIYWIVAPRKKWQTWHYGHVKHSHCNREKKQYEINDDFSKTHVFSSGEYIVLEPEFKGGEVKVVFGSSEIDLRKTSLPEGDTYLMIESVFSGVILFVPDDWNVETQIECVFSGITDKRHIVEKANLSKRLILVGSCVFSGCEIKN